MQLDAVRKCNLLIFLSLFLILISLPSNANPCQPPTISQGFGASFPTATTISGFLYDSNLDNMYINFPNIQYYTYLNVPYSVAYQFSQTRNPDTFYSQQIQHAYHAALSTELCQAILTDDGKYITVF